MIFLSSKIEKQAREEESERGEDKENLIKGQRNKEEGEETRGGEKLLKSFVSIFFNDLAQGSLNMSLKAR